ncbi:MAG: hypothetical protein PHV97_07070, partial [Candidatus Omnitrophica bacterium]|nr:hypothetical protein [Candidatus Omnitrophota bacterium]
MEVRKVYLSLLLLTLSNELINMGLIVWAGTQSNDPIQQTAWVAFWAATGYIFAIFLNLGDRFRVSRRILLFATIVSSGLAFLFPQMSILWGVSILIRNAIGQVAYSRFATVVPELVDCNEVPNISKNAQIAATIGNGGSMLLSPFISTRFGINGVFLVNLSLIVVVLLLTLNSPWLNRSVLRGKAFLPAQQASGWFNAISLMLIITWGIYGTF